MRQDSSVVLSRGSPCVRLELKICMLHCALMKGCIRPKLGAPSRSGHAVKRLDLFGEDQNLIRRVLRVQRVSCSLVISFWRVLVRFLDY